MMMAEIENPRFTVTELGILEQKIKNDIAESEDYEKLDKYLISLGLASYIINKMKEFNINSYEEYILKSKGLDRNFSIQSNIKGAALGVISALQSIYKTK